MFYIRLTNPNDLTRYTLEECGEHSQEIVVVNQGLHDDVVADIDELLNAGMPLQLLDFCDNDFARSLAS
jgi:predicted site-specific integrase-resolvase